MGVFCFGLFGGFFVVCYTLEFFLLVLLVGWVGFFALFEGGGFAYYSGGFCYHLVWVLVFGFV